MKRLLTQGILPDGAVLITCSSHEARCKGLLISTQGWLPSEVNLFHYDDDNPIREKNHSHMESEFRKIASRVTTLQFTEADAVSSLRDNMENLQHSIYRSDTKAIVIDISVFTKRHLLMMLRWLDDYDLWNPLYVVYSEPSEYLISEHIPLSFGLASLQQTPGFSACPDLSRPVHLIMFLGYEGDRAMAVYEHIQPMKTTLAVSPPPISIRMGGKDRAI